MTTQLPHISAGHTLCKHCAEISGHMTTALGDFIGRQPPNQSFEAALARANAFVKTHTRSVAGLLMAIDLELGGSFGKLSEGDIATAQLLLATAMERGKPAK